MSDFVLMRALRSRCVWTALTLALFVALPAQAQSTEEQRRRVDSLAAGLRGFQRPTRIEPSPRATDTTRAGALIVASEPELTPQVRAATQGAWTKLQQTFGAGAGALGRMHIVFVLQRVTDPVGNRHVALLADRREGSIRSTSVSHLSPDEVRNLGDRLAWGASHFIVGMFGEDVFRWGVNRTLGSAHRARLDANATIALASSSTPVVQQCVRGQPESCGELLGLNASDLETSTLPFQNISNHLHTRLLDVVLQAGGPEAPQRYLASRAEAEVQRFAVGAGIPADSLLALWRADLMRRRVPPLMPRAGNLAALLLLTLAFSAISWRRPVTR